LFGGLSRCSNHSIWLKMKLKMGLALQFAVATHHYGFAYDQVGTVRCPRPQRGQRNQRGPQKRGRGLGLRERNASE
jgi:hypothetical protein